MRNKRFFYVLNYLKKFKGSAQKQFEDALTVKKFKLWVRAPCGMSSPWQVW